MNDFSNFRAVYDELTDEVARSSYQFVAAHFSNWFALLDETPSVAAAITRLQEGLDFRSWYEGCEKTVRGMVGSGKLTFPAEKDKSLGMRLLLFREMASGRIEPWRFAHSFVYTRGDLNVLTSNVIDQIFLPFAREFRRHLETLESIGQLQAAPASDRIVALNHNSAGYAEALKALETLERAIVGNNGIYADEGDKSQHVAEVSALRRILQATKVKVMIVVTLASSGILYLARTFFDSTVGKAAEYVLEKLGPLIGWIF
ncbi:MAG: hypothetical protein AB7V13_12730 [Pseudorhodoplanes sp.]